jgi:hypothetical protein
MWGRVDKYISPPVPKGQLGVGAVAWTSHDISERSASGHHGILKRPITDQNQARSRALLLQLAEGIDQSEWILSGRPLHNA